MRESKFGETQLILKAGSPALTTERPHSPRPPRGHDSWEKAVLCDTCPRKDTQVGTGVFIFTEGRGGQEAKASPALKPASGWPSYIDHFVLPRVHLHSQQQEAGGRGISQLRVSIASPHPSPLLWLSSALRKSLRNANGQGENRRSGNDEWAKSETRVCS